MKYKPLLFVFVFAALVIPAQSQEFGEFDGMEAVPTEETEMQRGQRGRGRGRGVRPPSRNEGRQRGERRSRAARPRVRTQRGLESPRVKAALGLTEEQVESIKALQTSHREALRTKMEALRKEIGEANVKHREDVMNVFTPSQQEQIKNFGLLGLRRGQRGGPEGFRGGSERRRGPRG